MTATIEISAVWHDKRGKTTRDGKQEHCVTVADGPRIKYDRSHSYPAAEQRRLDLIAVYQEQGYVVVDTRTKQPIKLGEAA